MLKIRGLFVRWEDRLSHFTNICHYDTMWHAKSAFVVYVTLLGPRLNLLTQFKDLDGRLESLGT